MARIAYEVNPDHPAGMIPGCGDRWEVDDVRREVWYFGGSGASPISSGNTFRQALDFIADGTWIPLPAHRQPGAVEALRMAPGL